MMFLPEGGPCYVLIHSAEGTKPVYRVPTPIDDRFLRWHDDFTGMIAVFFFSNVFGFFFMCCVDVPRSLIVFLANQVVLLGVAWLQIVKTSPLRLRSSDFSPWQKKEC